MEINNPYTFNVTKEESLHFSCDIQEKVTCQLITNSDFSGGSTVVDRTYDIYRPNDWNLSYSSKYGTQSRYGGGCWYMKTESGKSITLSNGYPDNTGATKLFVQASGTIGSGGSISVSVNGLDTVVYKYGFGGVYEYDISSSPYAHVSISISNSYIYIYKVWTE